MSFLFTRYAVTIAKHMTELNGRVRVERDRTRGTGHSQVFARTQKSQPYVRERGYSRQGGRKSHPFDATLDLIVNAQVTLGVLEAAKELNVPAVWCQPGTTDEACETYIKDNGMSEKVIFGGPCVLVMGDKILASL